MLSIFFRIRLHLILRQEVFDLKIRFEKFGDRAGNAFSVAFCMDDPSHACDECLQRDRRLSALIATALTTTMVDRVCDSGGLRPIACENHAYREDERLAL